MKGKLIVLEGIDGVGKTTLARLLQQSLLRKGISVLRYEEVEKKRVGFNRLKPFVKTSVPIDASLYFYLASAIDKSRRIEALLRKHWVICDRYVYSTIASHAARGADVSLLPPLQRLPLLKPDFFFLITVADGIRLKRVQARSRSTPTDLIPCRPRNVVGKMQRALEAFNPIVIDNSFPDPRRALQTVEGYISSVYRLDPSPGA